MYLFFPVTPTHMVLNCVHLCVLSPVVIVDPVGEPKGIERKSPPLQVFREIIKLK